MRKLGPKDYFTYFAPAIVLTLAGFFVAYQFVDPAPPRKITIAAGRSTGTYFEISSKYRDILAREGVTLTVKETSGSVENLKLITDKNSGVDVIFLQGGIGTATTSEDLVSLGSIYYEPLWLFHRADIPVQHLSDLRGKRIAAGIEGSGTKALATQLLALNDVNDENSSLVHIGDGEATKLLLSGDVDAAFFVVALRSNTRTELLSSPNVMLMSFRRGEGYTKRLPYLTMVKFPEGTYNFAKNIPESDIFLLAPTAQLVTRKDFHPALIDLLLQASKKVGSPAGMFEKRGEFPAPKYLDYPLSVDAERFYASGPPFLQRFLPFWLANLLTRMKIMLLPLVLLLLPLIKLLPPFYIWRVRSRIYRWYDELMKIDAEILDSDIRQWNDEFIAQLNTIEQSVSQISVPLGFSGELYDLRVHIELLREKLLAARGDASPASIERPVEERRP